MNDNPWHHLPDRAPFVLPEDESVIQTFNEGVSEKYQFHNDILPEPFVGDPNAPVVLLSNNPGYKPERVRHKLEPRFMARMRDNLIHRPSDYPFVFFAPDIDESHQVWWNHKLKGLLDYFESEKLARSILARSIFVVEHFPYSSERYRGWKKLLPSKAQEYNISLVEKAIERKAIIVLMRGKSRWLKAVRQLHGYEHLCELQNHQAGTISRKNCQRFEDVVQAIKASRTL